MRDLINLVLESVSDDRMGENSQKSELDEKASAYHGSPYNIDKFSLKYIGAGEGAQAFGWGLYFAQDAEIANWYADKLSRTDADDITDTTAITLDGKTISSRVPEYTLTPLERAAFAFWYAHRDQTAAIADTEYSIKMLPAGHPNRVMDEETLEVLKSTNLHGRVKEAQPTTYTVEFDAEDDEFMLWEAPLSRQPENVRRAFHKAFGGDEDAWEAPDGSIDDSHELNDVTRRTLLKIGGRIATKSEILDSRDFSGEYLYRKLSRQYRDNHRRSLDDSQADRLASMFLLKHGVPGHKFLDGKSRREGEGRYNYVVYSGDLVTITDRVKKIDFN